MDIPRGPLRGSDGLWTVPATNRVAGSYVLPGGLFGWTYNGIINGIPLWGAREGTGTAVAKLHCRTAPLFSRNGLRRAGYYPLAGTLDDDFAVGYEFASAKGFDFAARTPIRYPRTLLVVVAEGTMFNSTSLFIASTLDPAFITLMNARLDTLRARGVDTFVVLNYSRFGSFAPCSAIDGALDYPSDSNRNSPVGTYIDPTVLNGGDVMISVLGGNRSGYHNDGVFGGLLSPIGYVTMNPAGVGPPDGSSSIGTNAAGDWYAMDARAAAENAALRAVAARCRSFRYDVAGVSDDDANQAQGIEDVFATDARFRGALNGSAFQYQQFSAAGMTAYVTELISRAETFFA